MDNLKDLQNLEIPRQTTHISWHGLRDIASRLLKRLLKRKVSLDIKRSEHYDWNITLLNDDSLTIEEQEKLFEAIDADDWDRESNDFDS